MKDDRSLETGAQRQAADWVRNLPEEEIPSLAWRSALNERVREEAARRSRRRWRLTVLSPSLGLATAAAMAAVFLFPRAKPATPPAGSRLEASLFALHQDAVRTDDIVGTGVRPSESPDEPAFAPQTLDDLDAGAL